ncbi:UNVERIFIED_CONTAM: menaquinone-dependent protoporphyrinogen oxidase [Acetivibrio alkalicellulosi]
MNTLVVYATKHGTTGKCASMLEKKLEGKVQLHNLKEGKAPQLDQYSKVIIGGSIYAGRIQKEVSEFCSQNINELKNKKLGLFICCMSDDNIDKQLTDSFPQELLNCSIAKEGFGGELLLSKMNFFERFIIKMVSKAKVKEKGNDSKVDINKDNSMILHQNIEKFAGSINNA